MFKKIKIKLNNLYLFENNDNQYLLFDTGENINENKLIQKINNEIGDFNKIKVIVISHSHSDHIGNLKFLMDKIGEKIIVIAHTNSCDILLSGEKTIPDGFLRITRKISENLKRKQKNSEQEEVNKLLESDLKKVTFLDFKDYESFNLEKYGFKNLKVISTGGHSADSISLALENKYLFCGDLIQNILWSRPLIPLFGDDFDELLISWKKIIGSKYSEIYPAMGKSVSLETLERTLNKYEKNRI